MTLVNEYTAHAGKLKASETYFKYECHKIAAMQYSSQRRFESYLAQSSPQFDPVTAGLRIKKRLSDGEIEHLPAENR